MGQMSLDPAAASELDVRYIQHPWVSLLHIVPGVLFLTLAPLQFVARNWFGIDGITWDCLWESGTTGTKNSHDYLGLWELDGIRMGFVGIQARNNPGIIPCSGTIPLGMGLGFPSRDTPTTATTGPETHRLPRRRPLGAIPSVPFCRSRPIPRGPLQPPT